MSCRRSLVLVTLDHPLTVAGWITPSASPDDDNVGLWAAADNLIRDWSYSITASAP